MDWKDKEQVREYKKQYHLKNQEKIKEYLRLWYKNNQEKVKAYQSKNREKSKKYSRKWYKENKTRSLANHRKWVEKNKEINREYQAKWEKGSREKRPWLSSYSRAKTRCNNKNLFAYKRYGGRGIKFKLTLEEIKELWFRDKAFLMEQPSIDRINNDGNYEFNNCQFLTRSENSKKGKK